MLQHKGPMRIVLLLGVLCSARCASSATIPPLQLTNPSPNDIIPGVNSTGNIINAVGDIDPRFRIKATYSDVDTPENDCLMNVIIAMGIVSAGKPSELIKPTTYVDARYVGARVLTRSTSMEGLIVSDHVLWGLYQAIRPMLQWNTWKEAEFTLLLDGETVGFLSFRKTGFLPPPLQESTTSNTIARSRRSTTPPPPTLGTLDIYNPANPPPLSQKNHSSRPNVMDDSIDVEPTSFKNPMQKINFFMALFDTYLYLNPKAPRDPLEAFSIAPSPYDAVLRLTPVSRAEGPRFDYGDAALGLATVPGMFIEVYRQRWMEVRFDYLVDGFLVGLGSITRAKS